MAHSIQTRLRGLVAAFVAVFAALALVPGTAFAADGDTWSNFNLEGSITITDRNITADKTINVYKVADIQLGTPSNETRYQAVSGIDQQTVKDWADTESGDADKAAAIAQAVDQAVTSGSMEALNVSINNYAGGGIIISSMAEPDGDSLTPGIYYIDIADDVANNIAYQDIVVAIGVDRTSPSDNTWKVVSANVSEVKSSSSQLQKSVLEDGEIVMDGDNVDHSVSVVDGQKVTFRVDFELSANMSSFYLEDSMEGLTFTSNSVELFYESTPEDAKVNGDFFGYDDEYVDEGFYIDFKNIAQLVALNDADGNGVANFYITYTAQVNDDANAGNDGASNTVKSEVNGIGDKVTLDLAKLTVKKFSDDNENGVKDDNEDFLAGAEFKLYTNLSEGGEVTGDPVKGADGEDYVLTTGSDGSATSEKFLDPDQTYYLVETKAPAGYQLSNVVYTVQFNEGNEFTVECNVPNKPSGEDQGFDLPVTGGPGTVALTAAGVVLVAGAAAFIVRSRKQN